LLLAFSTSTVFVNQAWPQQVFQIGIFALACGCLLWKIGKGAATIPLGVPGWLVLALPAWGVLQILLHTTASTLETRQAALRWGSLAGVFLVTLTFTGTYKWHRVAQDAFLGFASVMGLLCLAQLFSSQGKVLWIFPTGYPDVYGTFPNHNNYTQFIELALPIALWRSLTEGWRSWWYLVSAGILSASVVASVSRMGLFLCVAELLVILAIRWIRRREFKRRGGSGVAPVMIAIPLLAIILPAAIGWQEVLTRFKQSDPYFVRREYIASAIEMAKRRPLTGFGLDTFPEVYQEFATKDFPFYANHTHCDWAEFAADGGVPFLILVLVPLAFAIPTSWRHPWGLGLPAVMLHACLDFPFPRVAVSGWIYFLLALLFMMRHSDTRERRKP
jgi:hypothetical protein